MARLQLGDLSDDLVLEILGRLSSEEAQHDRDEIERLIRNMGEWKNPS